AAAPPAAAPPAGAPPVDAPPVDPPTGRAADPSASPAPSRKRSWRGRPPPPPARQEVVNGHDRPDPDDRAAPADRGDARPEAVNGSGSGLDPRDRVAARNQPTRPGHRSASSGEARPTDLTSPTGATGPTGPTSPTDPTSP